MKVIIALWRGLWGPNARRFYYEKERRAFALRMEDVYTDPRCRGVR